jgi:hypothetical protein
MGKMKENSIEKNINYIYHESLFFHIYELLSTNMFHFEEVLRKHGYKPKFERKKAINQMKKYVDDMDKYWGGADDCNENDKAIIGNYADILMAFLALFAQRQPTLSDITKAYFLVKQHLPENKDSSCKDLDLTKFEKELLSLIAVRKEE